MSFDPAKDVPRTTHERDLEQLGIAVPGTVDVCVQCGGRLPWNAYYIGVGRCPHPFHPLWRWTYVPRPGGRS